VLLLIPVRWLHDLHESKKPRPLGLAKRLATYPSRSFQALGSPETPCFHPTFAWNIIPPTSAQRPASHHYFCSTFNMTSKKRTSASEDTMSPSSPSTDCNPHPSKRPRRMTESQLSRKRALDRAAQRNSRARTRDRIEYLESLVESLQTNADADRVAALLQQVDKKEAEIQRLKSVLSKIGKQVDLAVKEALPSEKKNGRQCDDDGEAGDDDRPSSPAVQLQASTMPIDALDDHIAQCETEEHDPHEEIEDVETTSHPAPITGLNYNLATATGNPSPQCQSITQLASSIANNTQLEGRQWYLAGAILNHLLNMPDDTIINTVFDEEIAIRAIFHGWSSVIERYSLDRGWQWLKELDERIYFHNSIPLRLMHLRYCRLMFLHQRFPSDGWGALMPSNLRLRPNEAGLGLSYDALADYFPWPAFREKLRLWPGKFATTKFMDALVANVDCTWTWDVRDLYSKDPSTGLYRYSEFMSERVNDVRCFNMSRDFFEIFPELKGDIPCRTVLPCSLFPGDMREEWTQDHEADEVTKEQRCSKRRGSDDAWRYSVEGIGSPLPAAIARICEVLV
jgi:hypothetical protein